MKQPLNQIYIQEPSLEAIRIIDQSIRVFILKQPFNLKVDASIKEPTNQYVFIYLFRSQPLQSQERSISNNEREERIKSII